MKRKKFKIYSLINVQICITVLLAIVTMVYGTSPGTYDLIPGSLCFDFTFTFHFHALEKEMATHSSVLAWRIPGTGEPGGLPSVG